ncbi:MAG: ATP-binding protein [Acidimicrobiia bacterium]|nr:ATP-binding protein [Acidimicrobiia bacterium]
MPGSFGVARACSLASAGLSAAGLIDIVRTRRFGRRWIVADAALAATTNLVPLRWATADSLRTLRYDQMMALVVAAAATADFAPVAVSAVLSACMSWVWHLASDHRRRPESRVPVVAASLEPALTYVAIALAARRLRAMEAELDALRENARRDAEAAAIEVERERQHRLLHDTALQTLEAVAGDWSTDDGALRALAAADAAQLRRALEGSTADDLESALVEIIDTYRRAGLDVTLHLHGVSDWTGTTATELAAAAREALVNVLKHAGPAKTTVTAEASADEVTVTVADDGAGFDITTSTPGFGIEHSIRRRLAEVDGHSEIDSAPGRGTTVRLRVPRR